MTILGVATDHAYARDDRRATGAHIRAQLRIAGFVVLSWFAVLTAGHALIYLTHPAEYDAWFRQKYLLHHETVLLHGLFAIVALALGPLQFVGTLRSRWPLLHRAVGMIYLLAVGVASCSGFVLATMAFGGPWAVSGFEVMSLAWLVTGALALSTAKQRRFAEHRRWMLRNYALTFGASMLRVELMIFGALGVPFPVLYPLLSWMAWLPNLLVAERLCRPRKDAK